MDKFWCEEYQDYYGNSHPEYGGILTDLRTLPVGTEFYVANGAWYGEALSSTQILVHSPFGDKICALDDNHHALYIERMEE